MTDRPPHDPTIEAYALRAQRNLLRAALLEAHGVLCRSGVLAAAKLANHAIVAADSIEEISVARPEVIAAFLRRPKTDTTRLIEALKALEEEEETWAPSRAPKAKLSLSMSHIPSALQDVAERMSRAADVAHEKTRLRQVLQENVNEANARRAPGDPVYTVGTIDLEGDRLIGTVRASDPPAGEIPTAAPTDRIDVHGPGVSWGLGAMAPSTPPDPSRCPFCNAVEIEPHFGTCPKR